MPTFVASLRRAVFGLVICALSTAAARAEHEGRVQVLLLGDSTTIGSVCRRTNPDGPHLEDVIRLLASTEKDLPPLHVINQGRDGEYIHGLLAARYDRDISELPGIDYVFIRYGLNDLSKRENFDENFIKDFRALIERLRGDFPKAVVVPTVVIPYLTAENDERINKFVRQVAEEEKLPLLDLYDRYKAELAHGPNMLNYRRAKLEALPAEHRDWVTPFLLSGSVVVMDNRLDAHFRHVPGWFSDRHPNLAGYHVIGDATTKFLVKLMRDRKGPVPAGK